MTSRIGIDGRYIQDHFPGIGRYTYNLVRALARIAPGKRFVLLYNPALPNTRHHIQALGSLPNLELVPVGVPTFSPAEQWQLPSLVRRLRLDLFHSPYYIKPYLLPCPSVVSIYDLIPARYPRCLPSWRARLAFSLAIRLAIRTSRHVITLSRASKRDLMELCGIPEGKVTVTHLAADERFRPASPEEVDRVRDKYGLPERYVLYLGINKPHKNLVRLVEAWARLEVNSELRLVLAGREDPRYPQARQRAIELGLGTRLLFLGDVAEDDLPALYSGALLFVFPSLYEGFGLPVLEAMACGVPVACSATSSLPEIVGQAALLFDPTSPEQMAEAMAQALRDEALRERLREEGLRRAKRFSWEETARRTLEAYSR